MISTRLSPKRSAVRSRRERRVAPSPQAGRPSPRVVAGFDDCLATLASLTPDWIAVGVEPIQPHREPRWHVVERVLVHRTPFYCFLAALCGVAGWLTEASISAIVR